MANRDVSVSIRYAIEVAANGLTQAIALSRDLGTVSKETSAGVSASMDAVTKQYNALAKIAVTADGQVSKAAIDCSVAVNKALDTQIAKLRDAGNSYTAIVAKQKELGVSSAQLAASIEASSKREITAMQAARAEADKKTTASLRSRVSTGVSSAASKVGGAAATVARGAGGAALGALAVAGGLAYEGIEKSRGIAEGTLAISGSTGVSKSDSLALSTIGSALGLAPRTIAQSLTTLGSQVTKALTGSKTSVEAFQTLGLTQHQVEAGQNKPIGLFDMVTKAAAKLPATQQSAVQRTLLGRGSTIVGQLTEGGTLGSQVAGVKADLPGVNPKQLVDMQHEFVQLKEVSTAFELSFAQAFGPTIQKVLSGVIPLMKPLASGMKTAFSAVGDFFKGSTGSSIVGGLVTFGKAAYQAGGQLVSAFKPAQPFFQNVLLPLVKGLAEGVGIGLVGAIKITTVAVQILAPVLGVLGNVMKPLGGVIEDVGKVLGIFFSGDVLGGIAKALGAVAGEIPFLGKVLEALLKPVELVGDAVSGLYKIITGAFSKILGYMGGLAADFGGVLGGAAKSVVDAFSGLPGDMLTLGENIVNAVVSGIGKAPNAIVDALMGLLPKSIRGLAGKIVGTVSKIFREGGTVPRFAAGGLVPAFVSSGEMIVHNGMAAMVPGQRVAADNVFAMLPPGAAVMTGHGQSMMASGASLDQALAGQMPHFATGGKVGTSGYLGFNIGTPASQKAPAKVNEYIKPGTTSTIEHVTAAVHSQQEIAAKVKKASTVADKWTTIGATVYDDAGATSSGKHLTRGFAELSPAGVASSQVTFDTATALGRLAYGTELLIRKNANAAAVTAAKDDIGRGQQNNFYKLDMGRALAQALGVSTSTFKGSIQVAPKTAGEPLSALAQTTAGKVVKPPTLSNAPLSQNDILSAAFQAGLSGQSLAQSGILSQLIANDAVSVSSSGLIAGSTTATSSLTAAGSGLGGSAGKMVSQAQALNSKRYNYEWGGGHNAGFLPTHGTGHGSGPGIGYDCSGAVSSVLHAGGALKAPLVASQFMNWGAAGKGKNVSIFASPVHTFMELAGRYFGTSTKNPGGGAGWLPGFPESMPATRHPPGLRRGGRIPRFSIGGAVSRAASTIGRSVSATAKASPLSGPLGTVSSLTALPDVTSGQVTKLMNQLAAQLDNVGKLTISNLESLVAQLSSPSATKGLDSIQARRVQNAALAVQAEIMDRVGQMVAAAQTAVDQAFAVKTSAGTVYGSTALSNLLARDNIDSSSTQGLLSGEAFQLQTASALNAQIGVLNQALATAKKYGDPTTIATVTGDLNTALAALDDATTQAIVDQRQAIEQAAQDVVDQASQAESVAQAGQSILGLQQQLAGTDQTPGGGQQMAAYINQSLIPSIQAHLAATQGDEAAASSVGDTARVNQDILTVLSDQQAILQAQLDAQNDIKANTDNLKQLGGSLGLTYNQESFTDYAGIGTGT
jgi:hypothetical protein